MNSETLNQLIRSAVDFVQEAGLTVKVTVVDQEATQWRWVRSCNVSPKSPFIFAEESEIFVMPDPPHLIKKLRNHLKMKDICFSIDGVTGIAKWEHLVQLFGIDCTQPCRAVPRLTNDHFKLPRNKTMKLDIACQIFSKSAAAGL